MTQFKFKADDKVKRVYSSHEGMKVGDIAVVESFENSMNMFLKGYSFAHDPQNFELVVEDEKETITHILKTKPWWIAVRNQEEYNNVQNWLGENYGSRCIASYNSSMKYLTNISSVGSIENDWVMHGNGDKPKEKEIILEFQTTIKSVKLPEKVKPTTEQQLKIAELEKTIAKASAQIEQLKEMK